MRNPRRVAVLSGAFFVHFICGGIPAASGVLFREWSDAFPDAPRAELAWIVALNNGLILGCSPLSSLVISKIGLRLCFVLGCLLSALGLGISSLAQEPYQLMLLFGVLSGLGNSMAAVPAAVVSNLFFEERQLVMISAIYTSGIGAGMMAGGPFLEFLIDRYGWAGCLILVSGVTLQGCVLWPLMRPPSGFRETGEEICEDEEIFKDEEICKEKSYNSETVEKFSQLESDLSQAVSKSKAADDHHLKISESAQQEQKAQTSIVFGRQRNRHLKLWLTPTFVILFIAEIQWNIASIIMLSMLPEAAKLAGLSNTETALLVTYIGAANFLGLAISVPLSYIPHVSALVIFAAASASTSFSFLFFPMAKSFLEFGIVAAGYGLGFGVQVCCIAPAIIQVIPIRYLVISYGWLLLADGIGNLSGAPLAGVLFDITQSFDAAFIVGGFLSLSSAALMLITLVLLRSCYHSGSEK